MVIAHFSILPNILQRRNLRTLKKNSNIVFSFSNKPLTNVTNRALGDVSRDNNITAKTSIIKYPYMHHIYFDNVYSMNDLPMLPGVLLISLCKAVTANISNCI